MKKRFLLCILIIILVFINWFTDGIAQTSGRLTKTYQEELNQGHQNGNSQTSGSYRTPSIYDEEELANDSLLTLHRQKTKDTAAIFDSQYPDSAVIVTENDERQDIPENRQLILPDENRIFRFGHKLFENRHVSEINTSQVPDDYLLGPGDNLIISLWGRVQQEWNVTVDREGKIFIPKVGEITAWGMKLAEFENRLDNQLAQVYTGYKKRVTLGKIRTIRVFVYGEVKAPGGYAMSALSSLFNALYMAGGPTENGSFRNIKLIRNNKSSEVDLYDFLINGNKSCDLPLLSGDVVFVPLVGPQATVRGEVKRPGVYELKGGEQVSGLLELAGGPSAEAHLGRLMLDRISDDDSRRIIDIDFQAEDKNDLTLVDGDDLSVFSIYQMRHNLVWITGEVKHPGTFERTTGMTVSDLIDKGQLLPNNVYLGRADLYRHLPDGRIEIKAIDLNKILANDSLADIPLTDLDSLQIYHTDSVAQKKYVYIDGLVKNPGRYLLYENMAVSDLIFISGNLRENAYLLEAELARIDERGNTSVITLSLTGTDDGNNLILKENDHLFIRQIPGYKLHRIVTINGEIKFPGCYSLTHRDETLWELLQRAGGFTKKAFPVGTIFKREAIIEDLERKNIASIVEGSLPLLADSTGTLKPVETIRYEPETMDRIIVDMEKLIATGGAEGDIKLQTGDFIYVPEIPTGITVMGEVCASGTITYQPGKTAKFYLGQAGGFSKRADKKQTRLVKANGRVYASGKALGQKAGLGDVIIVPTEIKKERDWLKIFTTTASIVTGLATTVLIIDKL